MTESDFLTTLRKALNGQVPASVVTENLNYYASYFADEIRKGRSEQEILDDLGDPRLLARTIIDAEESKAESSGRSPFRSEPAYDNPSSYDSNRSEEDSELGHFSGRRFTLRGWQAALCVFLVLFLFFSILGFIFKTVFKLLFSFKGIWFWVLLLILLLYLSRKRS